LNIVQFERKEEHPLGDVFLILTIHFSKLPAESPPAAPGRNWTGSEEE
jgi:hypothetical protein